jgi:hypothetical protein
MKRIAFLLVAVATAAVVASPAPVSGHADAAVSPIYGVTIPSGYRDWEMIALNTLKTDKVDKLRAQLGNDIAIKAYKEGTLPFPDGAIIVALHWTRVPSELNNKVFAGPFPGAQSSVVGSPVNMQVMVKDSKKYAATGGWGFGDFKDGQPGDEALHETLLPRTYQRSRLCLHPLRTLLKFDYDPRNSKFRKALERRTPCFEPVLTIMRLIRFI